MGERATGLRMVGGGLALLGVSWWAASGDSLSGLEEDAFRLFNDLPDWLEGPIWPIMQLGAIAAVPVVAVVAWLSSRRQRLGVGIAVVGFVSWVLAKVVKEIVGRGRPQEFLGDVNLRPEWEGLGFVSGHAAVAFAMAAILSPYLSRPWRAVAWALALATGVLRMYTAAHLPLDITGGAGLGIALAGLWHLAVPPNQSAGSGGL
jgi:undecaprenyl-diphosphatase